MGAIEDALKIKEPRQRRESSFVGAFSGKVTKATAAEIWFTLDDYSKVHEFGPAPYPRQPASTDTTDESGGAGDASFEEHHHSIEVGNPPKGTVVLVHFAAGDPGRPYVAAVYGWPA